MDTALCGVPGRRDHALRAGPIAPGSGSAWGVGPSGIDDSAAGNGGSEVYRSDGTTAEGRSRHSAWRGSRAARHYRTETERGRTESANIRTGAVAAGSGSPEAHASVGAEQHGRGLGGSRRVGKVHPVEPGGRKNHGSWADEPALQGLGRTFQPLLARPDHADTTWGNSSGTHPSRRGWY